MKTAVIIPCYNEAKTIERVIKDFREHLPHADIYVYDNNSTDGTYEIAKNAVLQFTVDNVFDREFYASEPTSGRVYSVGLRYSF